MRTIKHPLSGAVYDLEADGTIRVQAKDGRVGTFDKNGKWLDGDVKQADPHLWDRARALDLDVDRFEADRRDAPAAARVQRDTRAALAAGATTTPMLFAAGSVHSGVPDGDYLARLGYHDPVRIQKTS